MFDLIMNPKKLEEMKEIMQNVTTGQVTYAVRESPFENVNIKKGDYNIK